MGDKENTDFDQEMPWTDEELWQEFNHRLWHLVKQAEPAEFSPASNTSYESFAQSADEADFIPSENLRKKDCLLFVRYNEIAENPSSLTAAEKSHLEGCRHCERHIATFSRLLPPSLDYALVPDRPAERSWSSWLIEKLRALASPFSPEGWLTLPPAIVALTILVVLAGGLTFFLIKPGWSKQNAVVSWIFKDSITNLSRNIQIDGGSKPADSRSTAPKPSDSAAAPGPRTQKPHDELADNLSPVDRLYIHESLKAGEIISTRSNLEILQDLTTRKVKEKITQISPENEATIETYPKFRWQGPNNFEYRIILFSRDGKGRIPDFKVKALSPNDSQAEKELAPGFYFWRIEVRPKGGPEDAPFELVPGQIMFKIMSEKEKQRLDRAVNSTQSNLVRAILYARAGFLERAENELKAEQDVHPGSLTAKKMLAQIQDLRRK